MNTNSQARPLFWSVTGSDFARSIKWAATQRNPVADSIRAVLKQKGQKP